MDRLDKILVSQNVGSRKEVQKLIKNALVAVNGKPEKKPESKFDPEKDEISVQGEILNFQKYVYWII